METGGIARLWGGTLARVVRALPHDRVLVQDRVSDGTYTGRRHTTSARWITMVARPDGSAPTNNEGKVAEEDARRHDDPRRGNGVAGDDDGDPTTPDEPHDADDEGKPIGDDDGDGPGEDDDQDEPADGAHPVKLEALPNQKAGPRARFADTTAVRRHLLSIAGKPDTDPEMAAALRQVAVDEELRITPSSGLAVRRDPDTGRFYLTATGTGHRIDEAGHFGTSQEAERFAALLDETAAAGQGNTRFDFSDPQLSGAARDWRSARGENIQAAIIRTRAEFGNGPSQPAAKKTAAPRKAAAARPSGTPGQRFTTLSAVRAHWTNRRGGTSAEEQARLEALVADRRLKLVGNGQFVIAKTPDGKQYQLVATGSGTPVGPQFARQRDAQDLAARIAGSQIVGRDGKPLDLSDPDVSIADWRSKRNKSLAEVIDAVVGRPDSSMQTEGDPSQPTSAPMESDGDASAVSRADLQPGDRVTLTVSRQDLEWPDSTRGQVKPENVTVEGTIAPSFRPGSGTQGAPLVDVTLTDENGREIASGETVHVTRMPAKVAVSERRDGFAPEEMRADRVRVGDVIARGTFGHVVTDVSRSPNSRAFTTRSLGSDGAIDGFGTRPDEMLDVVPRGRRRPEDVQRDLPNRAQQHLDSNDAKRAAANILQDWARANALAEREWADGAPEQFQDLARQMQDVSDTPRGAEGYQQNAQAMHGALAALDRLETDGLNPELLEVLHRLEGNLDRHADKFAADARAITANKEKRDADAQEQRRAEGLQARPPVRDLDEEQLQTEYDELTAGDFRSASPEVQRQFESRLEDIKRERRDRARKAITGRAAPESLDTDQLREEQAELARARTSYEPDDVAEARKERMAAVEAELERRQTGEGPEAQGSVNLTPEDMSSLLDSVRPGGSKAPSSMTEGEIRDELVALMEREMAGELSGVDRTRMQVLEAVEARRSGRVLKRDPKPQQNVDEPGGLFDAPAPAAGQAAADPENPGDRPDDEFGTPDLFAAAEGRDTSKLRAPQKPGDLQVGDRFVDADGRTHTVAEEPVRTPLGRIRIGTGEGRELLLNPDGEVRVLHPNEEAPAPSAPGTANSPEADADSAPESVPAPNAPEDSDVPRVTEPTAASNQVSIEHTGTGTVVRFPTSGGRVSDDEFEALRRMGFKRSRAQQMFYLPSTWTLSRRDDKVRQLKEWLERQNMAYALPEQDSAEKPELSDEQLEALRGRYSAPAGTWAVTDFQPGDEVWTGSSWSRVDSVGPKNLRLQRWGPSPYDRVLARRRGGEIRTILDNPVDDGTPRPGVADPKGMTDGQIAEELAHLRSATLPEGAEPAARAVRRQVTARTRALTEHQSRRQYERQRAESTRRDQARLVRDPARLAAMKAEQVQSTDGTPLAVVYQEKKGKWRFVDRDGRMSEGTYPSRAAAITEVNKIAALRNTRAGDGWRYSAWDDVQAGDTVRVPELGPAPGGRRRTVTGWTESVEVSEVRRGDTGQITLIGRRGEEEITIEVPRADATFGTSKPGTVPERAPSDAGGGIDWRQMRPDDFGQDELSGAAADQSTPRPADEYGTPDLIANGTLEGAAATDEVAVARMLRERLPELPPLPNLGGLSRQDKDDVRRIRSDYANIVASLDGILAGDPPTGDAREDLRRVRQEFDYIFGRLTRHLLPDSDQAQTVRASLLELGEAIDQASGMLPERARQSHGEGPNGGTLHHPWDLVDGELVRFDALNPADQQRSLAPYFGTFRGASSASGEQGRTLVTYEGRRWNDDREQWENEGRQHTVTMPPRGLVERFTPAEWDAWRRPEQSNPVDAPASTPEDESLVPPAPIGDQPLADMTDEDIITELEALLQWQRRHAGSSGEGPLLPRSEIWSAVSRLASRRSVLHEEQRQRHIARTKRERQEKEAREKAEALGRATIGTPNGDAYPISIDGREIGTVRKLSRTWSYTHADGGESPDVHKSRGDAVAALVRGDDWRRERDAENAQAEEARTQTPEGWVLGDRDQVTENDIIRVPRTSKAPNGRRYPVGWREPVRVRRVNRRSDGTMTIDVESLDRTVEPFSTVYVSPDDVGFAWSENRTTPEPTPAYREPLRIDMADIGDDIATLSRLEGLDEPDRIRRLGALLQRVEDGKSTDLRGDLRTIRDETTWLEAQFENPDLPYETSSRKSWARAARMKAERALANPAYQDVTGAPDRPDEAPAPTVPDAEGRRTRMANLVSEASNAVGGDSLPEIQELRARVDRADSADDPDAELVDVGTRLEALADQYELGGPQGERAAELFRQAARVARGEQDGDENQPDGEGSDAPSAPEADTSNNQNEDGQDQEEEPRQAEDDQDRENRHDDGRRRRRRRDKNTPGGGGGPGGPDGPGMPPLGLPGGDDSPGTSSAPGGGGRGRRSAPDDAAGDPRGNVNALRDAWQRGDGLTSEENTPARHAVLQELANNEGLTLSPGGGLITWPETREEDGRTAWHFAQARNGTRLPGLTLLSDDREEARALAGRFEAISGSDGQPFDWQRPWGPSSVVQWRDGSGRNLPSALRAAQDEFEQERTSAPSDPDEATPPATTTPEETPAPATLPDDLTEMLDGDLAAAWGQGLSDADQLRVMAEMDRRDDADRRIREAVPDTPPTDADEAARRGLAMDAALSFGETDVVRPARTREQQMRAEFIDIDEARYLAAVAATNGYFFRREYMGTNLDERALFSGGTMSAFGRWERYASEELRDWFDANGGRLTFNEFKKRRRADDRRAREEYEEETSGAGQPHGSQVDAGDAPEATTSDIGVSDSEGASQRALEDARLRYAELLQAARDTWGPDAEQQLGGIPEQWELAQAALADNNTNDAVWKLHGLYEQVARLENQLGAEPSRAETEQLRSAMRPFYVAAHNAAVLLGVTPRDGERWTTYRALQSGDVFREPGTNVHRVVTEQPSGPGRGARIDLHNWQLDDQGGGNFRPHPDLYVLQSDDRSLIRQGRKVSERQAAFIRSAQEMAAARAAREGTAAEPREDDTATPQITSNGSHASAADLEQGDQVSVTGRNTRGVEVTREGQLLAAPKAATGRIDGVTVPVWRLHVGAEGEQPRPGNLVTLPREDSDAGPGTPAASARAAAEPAGVESGALPGQPEAATAPDPIGGQPAHWARVGDLVPGDLVRIDGTTRRGRGVTRPGYVYVPPVQVEVTRRGRTESMWRTYVTENPDGTGERGNVFTPLTATAARAEAPENTAPGAPATGAQSEVLTGELPDTIPTDRAGQGLFPGSTVTGRGGREGTITGATDTTVAVRWSDGDTDEGLSPSSLTASTSERPAGWTPAGQRVRPGHFVTDSNGRHLGPVDAADGDRITVLTAEGSVTRNAADLLVAGEVRDVAPSDRDPVSSIGHPSAADLKEGDTVILDFDGVSSTVLVVGEPSRDGDRVTIEYVDTTNGVLGELELDAAAVVPRAEGQEGGTPDLSGTESPEPSEELTIHEPAPVINPVTGPTVHPDLTPADREVIEDHGTAPEDEPEAQQAAARIGQDLPVTPEQAGALAAQLRASADPTTTAGRAALRAADHLDQAADRTPPAGLDRPRPSNAAQLVEGDTVAMPDERRGNEIRVYRVIDAEDGPGGIRSLLLEDEDQQWRRRIVHGAMPVWQLPEPRPDAPTPPDPDHEPAPAQSAPERAVPVTRIRPGGLRQGDVIDAPVSRAGYQFNGHRRLTLLAPPQRNGWWMALTGVDDDGNVHDFGLHAGREVNVYERNRPTPALPPASMPSDPNPAPLSAVERVAADHARTVAARIINEAIVGTEQPGDIHALREQIAQRLTPEALREARQAARSEAREALTAAGVTGRDRANAMEALKRTRQDAHTQTVRAALRTINDLEPLPDESHEDLARRAADLLRLIPDQIATANTPAPGEGDRATVQAVTGHTDAAISALLQDLQGAGLDAVDAETVGRLLAGHLNGSRQTTARRIAARAAATAPTAQQPGLLARIVALLMSLGRRLVALAKAAAAKIGETWRNNRDRLARLRSFLRRLATRVRQWPETRRLARLQAALDLPFTDGESLSARVAHWAGLMPEAGRFGQTSRRVTWWRPTTWGQLASGRLPDRSDRIQWSPDRAADGGPGLTALRHLAVVRAAGSDVDQDVTRRLAAELGDDFGSDPHDTLRHADDYVASTERRLVNLQAARSSSTIQDPEVEVEITAAQLEAATARREWAELRARYAAAVPAAVASVLSEIRDLGPEGSAGLVFTPQSTPNAERALRGVQNLIPRTWLRISAARRITAVDGDEGRYEPGPQRATVADLADDGLGTAGHALAQHLAQHLPDLDAAQRAFWFTRTHTGRPGARRMHRSTLSRLLSRQQTQPETGDSLARAVQSMFSGDWYEDDDLRAFLLGLLATR
ncbi:hypothetical protein BGK67_34990 (plasmid) [Streptomyces subrutilus]|uniref:Uncharacterized protein n=1 Tax=Streptomyces subrutilus TaxID=36818 RepID=A0A1E5NXV6_9ACTN|nr:hypothetical protein BGK67_34990 [Streptomyces subrutilus]